jgi:hypothetical protein
MFPHLGRPGFGSGMAPGMGLIRSGGQRLVSGHDFSRAEEASKQAEGFSH